MPSTTSLNRRSVGVIVSLALSLAALGVASPAQAAGPSPGWQKCATLFGDGTGYIYNTDPQRQEFYTIWVRSRSFNPFGGWVGSVNADGRESGNFFLAPLGSRWTQGNVHVTRIGERWIPYSVSVDAVSDVSEVAEEVFGWRCHA